MEGQSSNDPRRITYFGVTHTRGKRQMFGIRAIDRLKHMYVIGKTGVGKSTMLENMAIQDIQNGEGLIFIDPHGSSAEKLLDFVPQDRVKDVIYFAPFDTEYPIGFNIMENVGFNQRHKVVANLMGVFERLWADAWSARMQYILQNTLLALLEYPDSTLLDVNRMLINKEFRKAVVEKVTDPIVKSFWNEEFANYGDRYTQEATPAIQNKVGQLISNPLMRNIIAQPKSSFDLRKAMDEKKIFIANLSKGRMGDGSSTLIGAVLVVRAYIAAMSRADESPAVQRTLPPCYFYVDEFQNVVNRAFTNILSESRKYGLALIIANQYIAQLDEKDTTSVKDAVFGNVGSTIMFKVGPLDAQELEPLFEPTFTVEDMVGLGVGQIYLTLSIDGITSPPFSADTIPPIEAPEPSYKHDIVEHTRRLFAKPRTEIEQMVQERLSQYPAAPAGKKEDRRGSFKPAESPRPPVEILRAAQNGVPSAPKTETANERREYAVPAPVSAPKRDETPRPQPISPVPKPATPTPSAPSVPDARAAQRSALREAIAAARAKEESPVHAGEKSPMDILRERKQLREREVSAPRPVQHMPREHERPETSPKEHSGALEGAAPERVGEVPNDILKRMLDEDSQTN